MPQYQDQDRSFHSTASRRTLEGSAGFVASHATFPFSQILLRLVWVLWTCLLTILSGRGFSALPLLIEYVLYLLTPRGSGGKLTSVSRHTATTMFSFFLHRTDALSSWRVLFLIGFSVPPPWHTVSSEFVVLIRARIALADLQLIFFGNNRSIIGYKYCRLATA